MLFGAYRKPNCDPLWSEQVVDWLQNEIGASTVGVRKKGAVIFAEFGNGETASVSGLPEGVGRMLAWEGEVFNRKEILEELGGRANVSTDTPDSELFYEHFSKNGAEKLHRINGEFAFALHDSEDEGILLGRDHLGIRTLYLYEDAEKIVFSTRMDPIIRCPGVRRELNFTTVERYLVFGYNPGWDTFYCHTRKVRPGTLLRIGEGGIQEITYWQVPADGDQTQSEEALVDALRGLIKDAVAIRMRNDERLGVFVSGGLDSSGIACLMRELSGAPIRSFSYRTLAKSYDESGYARIVAESCRFDHHEVVFHPRDMRFIEKIVKNQDEPLCSLGITVATYLLGREAEGLVDRVFSGHGGDELFGGHPVYLADRVANFIDILPRFVVSPITMSLRHLPDSDKKLNAPVKLKRFSESYNYPRELHTYRWRIYYGLDELNQLLSPEKMLDGRGYSALASDVIRLYAEAGSADPLKRSLYVDFHTEVNFHLRRMSVLRQFGLKPMFPLLDYRLVERTAAIPSKLKIRGFSDAKYIERKILSGIIPDQILNRKDKLGHSIPFKNWLRTEPEVRDYVRDILFSGRLADRGIFEPEYLTRLWDDHQSHRRNNSHRIWTLAVLELWLEANLT
jgi:asparagine synthase (glutamine-hydrolysing)